MELVDTQDLKSCDQQRSCGFNSHPGYKPQLNRWGFFAMFYMYILYSEKFEWYYVGHCEDLEKRLSRHNTKGVSSTKPYVPWEIVYTEKYNSRSEASAREQQIKNKKAFSENN